MSLATKKLSRLLRTPEETLIAFEQVMEAKSGKRGVLLAVAEENDRRIAEALAALDKPLEVTAEELYGALMEKITENDRALHDYLKKPLCTTVEGCASVAMLANQISGSPKGFFLKHEVAERLFRQNPPQNLMRELNVSSVDTLLRRFSLEQLFPAVRFAEDMQWLNDVFFHPYATLQPNDFEERQVRVVILPTEFREIGKRFSGKKLHHISHLKELGIIFVMPLSGSDHQPPPGSTLEIFTLVLHYLQEVPFYSRIFQRFAQDPHSFASNLVSALRGDVLPKAPNGQTQSGKFLIIQRYLAKEDASDPRLFQPHVNPEAIHWRLVEEKLDEFAAKHPSLGLGFWKGLGYVGEFFPMGSNRDLYIARGVSEAVEISFDFIDNLISHNRQSSVLAKYLYHQQEALWNELFYAFLGRAYVDAAVEANIEKGYIEVK